MKIGTHRCACAIQKYFLKSLTTAKKVMSPTWVGESSRELRYVN